MPRFRVRLDDVTCKDTEDATGADHFYLVGVVTDGENTDLVNTAPIRINDGETRPFNNTVFDHRVPNDDRILKVVLTAFDEDAAKSFAQKKELIDQLSESVSNALKMSGNPKAMAAGALVGPIKDVVVAAGGFDQDDNLGTSPQEYEIGTFPSPGQWKQATTGEFKGRWGPFNWEYIVRYTLMKG